MMPSDVPAAHVIRLRVRENRLSDPSKVTEQDYHAFMARDTMSWVCEVDGLITGFVMVDMEKRNLWALFVAPEHEGKGIGRRLHDAMCSAYFARKDLLRLSTGPASRAERFYRRAGYTDRGLASNGKELILELTQPDQMPARPQHLPAASFFERPSPTAERPLVVMMSACLGGIGCGVDGSTNGDHTSLRSWLIRPEVRLVKFCPEDFSFGTPRMTPDSHGGNGFDVLDGKARSLAEDGTDWTEGMVKAAYEMRDRALREQVELAILMDISGACGSTVTYLGSRFAENKVYQKGPGVAAASLIRAGIPVISQRDDRSLRMLRDLIEGTTVLQDERDHWEKEWYQGYFAQQQ